MKILETRPEAALKFKMTGQLPRTVTPDSPLIRLLTSIYPRDRVRIRGLTVDHRLGYTGRRQFHTAEQALNWLRPERDMVPHSWPADSWRDKRFNKTLTIEDLRECSASMPDNIGRV